MIRFTRAIARRCHQFEAARAPNPLTPWCAYTYDLIRGTAWAHGYFFADLLERIGEYGLATVARDALDHPDR